MAFDWLSSVILIGVFVLSALPLHRAVKIMKGKTDFFKTLIVTFAAGVFIGTITGFFQVIGGLISFVLLIWIYHFSFKLKWHKAVMVWVLHLLFVVFSSIILDLILDAFTGLSFLVG